MRSILLLNDGGFPAAFNDAIVIPPVGTSKVNHVEKLVIGALNKYNPKLKVDGIEYLKVENQFPYFKNGRSNGVIVEEFEINPKRAAAYAGNGCFVYMLGNLCLCRRVLMYVYVTPATEDARNAYVSQTVFPTLLDYANDYLASPSYSVANHKFCLINILNKRISSATIKRHLASLCAAGMDYVEVFNNYSVVPSRIPNDLKAFLKMYSSDFNGGYNAAADEYEDENYKVNFTRKEFVWKAAQMAATKLVRNANGIMNFNGSAEKFYWIEVMPMAILAYKLGYKVNFDEYEVFINTYRGLFSPGSDKFARCECLLEYIRKFVK